MNCTTQVACKTATSSQGGNCVAVGIHPTERQFGTASASQGGNCVGVDPTAGCGYVHVINTRFPDRVVNVRAARWTKLVRKTGPDGTVNLRKWFPWWRHGGFARIFTESERRAFQDGIRHREPQLVGPLA